MGLSQARTRHPSPTQLQPAREKIALYDGAQNLRSNTSSFKIIDTTLREGEQAAGVYFSTETKLSIARALDDFGVDYIEVTSPVASKRSRDDCSAISKAGLRNAKVLTHIRCNMSDAQIAVNTGVQGVNIVMGTSKLLREHSHQKDMNAIILMALEVIEFVKSKNLEVRFSTEDSFRSDLADLLRLYSTVSKIGVDRIGIADTVGCASPRDVYKLVQTIRPIVGCDIETHFHDDSGCAIANAFCALEAGATHIDTTVLGLGERNGITPLGGLIARMIVSDRTYVMSKYKTQKLYALDQLVAEASGRTIPNNNYITGSCAFSHKAGIHTKAVASNPETYEVIDPEDFGMVRSIDYTSSLTGWHAIKWRCLDLEMKLTDEQCKACAAKIKALADRGPISIPEADAVIYKFQESPRRASVHGKDEHGNIIVNKQNLGMSKLVDIGTAMVDVM